MRDEGDDELAIVVTEGPVDPDDGERGERVASERRWVEARRETVGFRRASSLSFSRAVARGDARADAARAGEASIFVVLLLVAIEGEYLRFVLPPKKREDGCGGEKRVQPSCAGHAARRTYRWCRPLTRGTATTFPTSLGSTSRVTGASPSRLMCGRSVLS